MKFPDFAQKALQVYVVLFFTPTILVCAGWFMFTLSWIIGLVFFVPLIVFPGTLAYGMYQLLKKFKQMSEEDEEEYEQQHTEKGEDGFEWNLKRVEDGLSRKGFKHFMFDQVLGWDVDCFGALEPVQSWPFQHPWLLESNKPSSLHLQFQGTLWWVGF